MNKSENIDQLAIAMAEVQAKLKPAEFDSEVQTRKFSYKYASLGSVIETIREALPGSGLSFMQFPISDGWYFGTDNIVMHTSGQWISERVLFPLDIEAMRQEGKTINPAQEAGKIITYSRRYGVTSMFGLYSDEDIDASGGGVEMAGKKGKVDVPEQKRPYTPETLRDKLEAYAELCDPASDKQRNLFTIVLNEYYSGDDVARHDALEYLFGVRSSKDIDGKLINSALKWMDLQKDDGGGYSISDVAKTELSAVRNALLIQKGQQKMDAVLNKAKTKGE